MVINGTILVSVKQVECLVNLLSLLLCQFSSFPATGFPEITTKNNDHSSIFLTNFHWATLITMFSLA